MSGVEDVRKGFKICKYCGKIQPDHGKEVHTFYCKTRKMPAFSNDPFEECLFLYREFATEALRILIPATTMDSSNVRTESFTAAFMLGMKEYFGNVDHLRATVSEVPVPDADYRKQYLVIYDSVPGGTGYLKQLMNEKNSLIDIFERALQKLGGSAHVRRILRKMAAITVCMLIGRARISAIYHEARQSGSCVLS